MQTSLLVLVFVSVLLSAQAKIYEDHKEEISKLSPEAQKAAKEISELIDDAHNKIDAILAKIPEFAKNELEEMRARHMNQSHRA